MKVGLYMEDRECSGRKLPWPILKNCSDVKITTVCHNIVWQRTLGLAAMNTCLIFML